MARCSNCKYYSSPYTKVINDEIRNMFICSLSGGEYYDTEWHCLQYEEVAVVEWLEVG